MFATCLSLSVSLFYLQLFLITVPFTQFGFTSVQARNDVDGALNKYKLIEADSQKSAEIWNNVGLCFYKKRKFIAVSVFYQFREEKDIGKKIFESFPSNKAHQLAHMVVLPFRQYHV